jgi:hypothetical protein
MRSVCSVVRVLVVVSVMRSTCSGVGLIWSRWIENVLEELGRRNLPVWGLRQETTVDTPDVVCAPVGRCTGGVVLQREQQKAL